MAHVGPCVKNGPDCCWHTSATTRRRAHLAPVPRMELRPPPLAKQLAQALEETRVSQRELAKRLAADDGKLAKSKRRWLNKLLKGEVTHPTQASLTAIEKALSLPAGRLVVEPLRRVRAEEASSHRRLEALEAVLNELAPEVALLAARVDALETQAPPNTGSADQ